MDQCLHIYELFHFEQLYKEQTVHKQNLEVNFGAALIAIPEQLRKYRLVFQEIELLRYQWNIDLGL